MEMAWWVKIQSSGVMHGERRAERHERERERPRMATNSAKREA